MTEATPSIDTAALRELDARHHLHPFTDFKALAAKGSRIIVRAEGCYLFDSEGNRILDGMAGLWCVNVGYGRRELADAAHRQLLELPYYNNFFQTTHPPAVALARDLAAIAPAGLEHVFFTNSGSEANDTVVRMVRRHFELAGEPERTVIVTRHYAYHGSTVAGISLSGLGPMRAQGGPLVPNIEQVMEPNAWRHAKPGESDEAFGVRAARALEEKIREIGPERVAAFLAEPIQGAGGLIVPPASYWPEVKRICREHGILLAVDEVICGFGRTGEWFGSDYYDLAPDLMPIAKGLSSGYLPIGGVMVGPRVAETLIGRGGEFHHGFTYSGHPAACAVASENLRILREEGIVERVRDDVGPYFQRRIRELADHPLVGEVRGAGLLGGIQLTADKATRAAFEKEGATGLACRDHCFEVGLVMRSVGDTMVLSPPLVISAAQVDELVDKARAALDLTARDVGTA